MLFNDATICFQHWQSCGSCHPDARVDGLNWDLLNDGLGNPKNTRSMLLVHQGGPAMSLGVRENGRGGRPRRHHPHPLRRPARGRRPGDRRVPQVARAGAQPAPGRRQAQPGRRARQEALLRRRRSAARKCHPEPLYTDKKSHDVGSAGKYDKPARQVQHAAAGRVLADRPLHARRPLPDRSRSCSIQGKHGAKGGDTQQALRAGHRRPGGVRALAVSKSPPSPSGRGAGAEGFLPRRQPNVCETPPHPTLSRRERVR